jgi:tripartite-type tricarboxylate transporter receptor subunit TctC
MLCKFGGVEMTHIPYKGDAQATNDLFGGQIAWKFGTILSMKPQIDAGLVRPLAVSGPSRIAALPNVPTIAETIPGFDATSLYGVVVPAGTPVEIVTRLNVSLRQLVESTEFRKLLTEDGATPVGGTPEQFGARLKLAIDKWNQIIKLVGVKAE